MHTVIFKPRVFNRYPLRLCLSRYLMMAILGICLPCSAQEASEERPAYGINQRLYSQLQQIEIEVSSANPEINPAYLDEAHKQLALLIDNCRRCNPYELASLYRFSAWLYYQDENFRATINNYENIVALSPEIPVSFEQEALLALSKLYLQQENNQAALFRLKRWQSLTDQIPADIFELEARIYYVLDQHTEASKSIDRAIQLVETENKPAKESWYLLQRSLKYSQEDFVACLAIQQKLVEHYSKDAHWRYLATFYGINKEEGKQIAALDVVWSSGGDLSEKDILHFAWLLQNHNCPYKAASVLEQAFHQGSIKRSAANLKVLAHAWYLSQEPMNSIASLEKAISLTRDPHTFMFLSELYIQTESWENALAVSTQALGFAEPRLKTRLQLTRASAFFYLERFDEALAAISQVAKDKKYLSQAEKWQKAIEQEKLRQAQLKILL